MSYALTNIDNTNLAEDYVSPTTGVWQTELELPQRGSHLTMRASDCFRGWVVAATESGNAFEDADFLGPMVFAEIDARALETIFVMLSSPEKPVQSLACTVSTDFPVPYIPKGKRLELSRQSIGFYPDFFNIRKLAAHVMGRTTVSLSEQEEGSETHQNIPITIHPEVLREGEERNLTSDLETSIRLAEETYVGLKRVEVDVEHDPEIVERKTIRFALTVSGDPETVLKNESLFKQRLRSGVSPNGRALITVTYTWER